MNKTIQIAMLLLTIAAGTSGCMKPIIQQGNVLKPQKVSQIQVGNTKFSVESLLGTPVISDVMHPNRATYIEEYRNPKTGKHYTRGIVITYDEELRVASIRKFGFSK